MDTSAIAPAITVLPEPSIDEVRCSISAATSPSRLNKKDNVMLTIEKAQSNNKATPGYQVHCAFMPFDKSHHECLNGSGSYVAAKTPILCSFSPFCAPFPPPKSHAPNQKPTQHHNGAYEDQNNELPNGVHRVRSYSDGEESMDRHISHARAAWDDTRRCKRVARKSGEDLAPRKESSHQPNLHKGCRRVPLNTCMFLTRLALTSLINKYGDAGMYPSCRRARQMLQGVGVTQSWGLMIHPWSQKQWKQRGEREKNKMRAHLVPAGRVRPSGPPKGGCIVSPRGAPANIGT